MPMFGCYASLRDKAPEGWASRQKAGNDGMANDCLFCRIASGKIGTHKVFESDRLFAFLDINPIRPGHTQIIPKTHYPYFDDMPADIAAEIVQLGQQIAKAAKAAFKVDRVGFLFTGGDIPHAHAHVVPLARFDDITSRRYIVQDAITYANPSPSPGDPSLEQALQALKNALLRP